MVEKVQSAGWIVYRYDDKANQPLFLLVKRFALSKKVEWISLKGKIQRGEKPEQAAVREISEEAGVKQSDLLIKKKLDTLSLQLYNNYGKLGIDKDITYFLVQYTGDPHALKIIKSEWFIGKYKWADIRTVLSLVTYKDLRELYRTAYGQIGKLSVRDKFLQNF